LYVFDFDLAYFVPKIGLRFSIGECVGTNVIASAFVGSRVSEKVGSGVADCGAGATLSTPTVGENVGSGVGDWDTGATFSTPTEGENDGSGVSDCGAGATFSTPTVGKNDGSGVVGGTGDTPSWPTVGEKLGLRSGVSLGDKVDLSPTIGDDGVGAIVFVGLRTGFELVGRSPT